VVETGRATGIEPGVPESVVVPGPVVAVRKQNPETAFLIEFLAGIFGLLGVGYLYAGQTNEGVVRLVVWLVYTILAWVVIGLLSAILVGVICIPFQLVLQIGVPLWSANRLKKQMLAAA
jgi:TM2 domain-containing membrane protein YozV